LLRQLARFHEVHAIVFQREAELRRETEGYKIPAQVQLYSPIDSPPPSGLFSRLPRKLRMALHYRWLRRSWRGPADAILLRSHHLIAQILQRQKIDAVVFEHLSSMRAAPLVRRLSRPTRAVLDAHNVDHRLMAQEFSQAGTRELTRQERKLVERTRWEERHLRSSVDAIWCCSEEDRRLLTAPNRIAGYTIPNGVDCSFFQFDERPSKAEAPWLIFSGALQTEANKNAVRWIIGEIWPRLRQHRDDLHLLLVGSGMPADLAAAAAAVPGIEVAGEVSDVRPFFRQASLALVPLRIGSGTRLKILEAMSQGNPVVSTRKGAEGLDASDGENLLLADEPGEFVASILRLLGDRCLFHRIRHAARAFAQQRYDWDVIGSRANTSLQQLLLPHA